MDELEDLEQQIKAMQSFEKNQQMDKEYNEKVAKLKKEYNIGTK